MSLKAYSGWNWHGIIVMAGFSGLLEFYKLRGFLDHLGNCQLFKKEGSVIMYESKVCRNILHDYCVCMLQCIIMVSRALGVVATGCCPRLASSFTCKHMAILNMTENPGSWFLSSVSIHFYRK